MKRVYSHPNNLLVHHMRNVLENAGIDCQLRNEFLTGGAGDLPLVDCWAEVWVAEHSVARAEQLIHAHSEALTAPQLDWRCDSCGTQCEGQFDSCWHCGALRKSQDT